ncbi:MAG: hypothetical protein SXG53_12000, partial [Pseudomonadota bacterium]|nr:hypothetical protein [Pseudomonadota bacterium]
VTDVGDIIVTGRRIFEVRTSEVATNVTQQQINDLPQISRMERDALAATAMAWRWMKQAANTRATYGAGTCFRVALPGIACWPEQPIRAKHLQPFDGADAGRSRARPMPSATAFA